MAGGLADPSRHAVRLRYRGRAETGGEAVAVVTSAPVAVCRLCAVSDVSAGDIGLGSWRVAYVDDLLVALARSDAEAVMVAPRMHVPALSTMPELAGNVLSGLRRAVLAVRVFYSASGATVQLLADVPGCSGHVCYQVVPTLPARTEPGRDGAEEPVSALVGHLALTMRPSGHGTGSRPAASRLGASRRRPPGAAHQG